MLDKLAAILEELDPTKPIIACDVDEVICPTAQQFRNYLAKYGYQYRVTDPWFQNWVIQTPDGRQMTREEIDRELKRWFFEIAKDQTIYPESAPTLRKWQQHAEVIILTNLWETHAALRDEALTAQGITQPIAYWQGNKTPALALIAKRHRAVAFVDDNVRHVNTVRETLPSIEVDHFIADPEIRALAEQTKAQASSNTWEALDKHLCNWLKPL
ncbi:MAG: hypothetical protein HWE20_02815 [Gammaproteobacteria bacterium]|nr:hypothetical protein [Gammaproteobacteria bacterium]